MVSSERRTVQITLFRSKISNDLFILRLFVSESYGHLLQPMSHKVSNVHFSLDVDSREHTKLQTVQQSRTISPLPISNATKYKSDSNPNLLLTSMSTISSTHTSHNIIGHNILTVDIFNKELLKDIFNYAEILRGAVRKERHLDHILRVKTHA